MWCRGVHGRSSGWSWQATRVTSVVSLLCVAGNMRQGWNPNQLLLVPPLPPLLPGASPPRRTFVYRGYLWGRGPECAFWEAEACLSEDFDASHLSCAFSSTHTPIPGGVRLWMKPYISHMCAIHGALWFLLDRSCTRVCHTGVLAKNDYRQIMRY